MEPGQLASSWSKEIIGFIVALFGLFGVLIFAIQRDTRIFRNLRKKYIYFFKTGPNYILTRENELMKSNKLLFPHVHPIVFDASKDTDSLSTITKPAVLIVGYNAEYPYYEDFVRFAQMKNYALILVAAPKSITDEHLALFNKLSYYEMCNTPSRLQSVVFNLAIITPYVK